MNTITTNIASLTAARTLEVHTKNAANIMTELATGTKRLDRGASAVEHVRISTANNAVASISTALRGINDAISIVRAIDSAASRIQEKLIFMTTLATTITDTQLQGWLGDQGKVCLAMKEAEESIQDIANSFSWNGRNFMLGGGQNNHTTTAQTFNVQTGGSAADTVQLVFKSFDPRSAVDTDGNINGPNTPNLNEANGTDTHAYGNAAMYYRTNNEWAYLHLDNPTMAAESLRQLGMAIDGVVSERGRLGAYISRLETMADATISQKSNAVQARSQLIDSDYAQQAAALSKQQILREAATALLAQANRLPAGVLDLLQ